MDDVSEADEAGASLEGSEAGANGSDEAEGGR
ncbi:hypothetical protein J2X26_003265 [Cellulomonas humilata]|uniref:Uncharacterized protein n=1 Tax=Cellulomonas humilata TaxID=144055 RepID=A0ABU0EI35_9CELL|nr:hypothetical protein [Cellulomonas humilata]